MCKTILKSLFGILVITMTTLLTQQTVYASLIGDTVSCSMSGTSQTCSTPTALVSDISSEFTFGHSGFPGNAEVNLADSSFTVTALRPLLFGGSTIILSDLDWGDPSIFIAGATLQNFGVTMSDTIDTPSITAFDADSVTVLLSGEWGIGDSILVTLETSYVPLPSAVWLFGTGAVWLLALARRKACD